jgi:antitoxin HicB
VFFSDLLQSASSEKMDMEGSVKGTVYKLPLAFTAQPERGYAVTCPLLPALITEGDTVRDALTNAENALVAVLESLEDLGRPLPSFLQPIAPGAPIWLGARDTIGVMRNTPARGVRS